MKSSQRLLGAYQFLGGLCTLISLGTVMWNRGFIAVAAWLALSVLALAAGASMWRGGAARWRLSVANQLVQLVGIHTPWFVWSVIHGAGLTITTRFHPDATLASTEFNLAGAITLGGSDCDVLIGRTMVESPDYGIALNFVAAGVLLYLRIAARKARP